MSKLKVGDICLFNKDNEIPMSSDKIIYAKIIGKKFSIRGWQYMCCISDANGTIINTNPMSVIKKYLTKLHPGEVVVVRYPEDIPIINMQDVAIIKILNSKFGTNLNEDLQIQLAKLIIKLELFAKVINEY